MAASEEDRIVEAAERAVAEAQLRLERAERVLADAQQKRDRARSLQDLVDEASPARAETLRRRLRQAKKEK